VNVKYIVYLESIQIFQASKNTIKKSTTSCK